MDSREGDLKKARLERKTVRQGRRRRSILEEALGLLLESGPEGFTIASVARRCALTKPAVYYYFKTKEDLVGGVALMLVKQHVDAMLEAVNGVEGGVPSLLAMVRARGSLFKRDPQAFRVLWGGVAQLGEASQDALVQIYAEAHRINVLLEARLVADQETGELHPDAHPRRLVNVAFLGAQGILNTASSMEQVGGSMLFSVDELIEELCGTLERSSKHVCL